MRLLTLSSIISTDFKSHALKLRIVTSLQVNEMPTETLFDPLLRKEQESDVESACVQAVALRCYCNFLECLLPRYFKSLRGLP